MCHACGNLNLIHYIKILLCFDLLHAAHIRSERLGDVHTAVLIKVVLEERDQHTGRCDTGVVEGMRKVLFAVLAVDADLQTACLRVAEVRTGTDLKILLLSGTPCLNVNALDLEISEVAGTALEGAYRYVEGTEEFDRILAIRQKCYITESEGRIHPTISGLPKYLCPIINFENFKKKLKKKLKSEKNNFFLLIVSKIIFDNI